MNMVPCLTWVAKGKAKRSPDKLTLTTEELKELLEEKGPDKSDSEEGTERKKMKKRKKNFKEEENESEEAEEKESEDAEEDEDSEERTERKKMKKKKENFKEEKESENAEEKESENSEEKESEDAEEKESGDAEEKESEDAEEKESGDAEEDEDSDGYEFGLDDFESKYNLDKYDNEEDDIKIKLSDVTVYADNKEDEYMNTEETDSEEEEEEEDFLIKDTDNLLIVGRTDDELSVLEIHVYNEENEVEATYVHHAIELPSCPLALEWLDYHPGDEAPGNYIAVADMTPVIKIWDLDVVDVLEPEYCLGEKVTEEDGTKKKGLRHKDAGLSLSWNKNMRNILASGSADSSIIIWDLNEGKALRKLTYHTGKVQSVQWHPFESFFLLSSCTEGLLKLYDCRSPDEESKTWTVEGEIERVTWNLSDSLKFFCSTEGGAVYSIDMRNDKIEDTVEAHEDAVTALDMCPHKPNLLLTGSTDQSVKLWDITDGFKLMSTIKLTVGEINTAKFAPDEGMMVAVGGDDRSNNLNVLDVEKLISGKGTKKIIIKQEALDEEDKFPKPSRFARYFEEFSAEPERGSFSGRTREAENGSFSGPKRGAENGSFSRPTRGAENGSFSRPTRGAERGSFSRPTRGAERGSFSVRTRGTERGSFPRPTRGTERGSFSGRRGAARGSFSVRTYKRG